MMMLVVCGSVLVLFFSFITMSGQFVIPSPGETNNSNEFHATASDKETDDLRNKERVVKEYIQFLLNGGIDGNGSLPSRRVAAKKSSSLDCYGVAISSLKDLVIRGMKLPWVCLRNVSKERASIKEEIKMKMRDEDERKELQRKEEELVNPKKTQNLLYQAAKLPFFQKIFSKSKSWYLFAKKFGGKTKSCIADELQQLKLDFIKTLYNLAVCLSEVDPDGFAARLLKQ